MKPSGKPDAGNLPVRFDEGDGDGEGRTISTLRPWPLVVRIPITRCAAGP